MNPLLVALDVDDASAALGLAERLSGLVGGFKVGSRLFTAEGPPVVSRLVQAGHRVFLDLKFHDIPNTVSGAIEAATRLGVWMVNVHASGGFDMMRAARAAADQASMRFGIEPPLVIAVTVLTSLDDEALGRIGVARDAAAQVALLARLAQDAGLDGVVASPQEIGTIRDTCGSDFLIVTPGIRGAVDRKPDDQKRTLGAAEAIRAGATHLVVGRPVVASDDPADAARRLLAEISG